MAKKRKPKLSIFIACEGSNTEPLYFEKLKEIQEDGDDYPFAITIYPDKEFDENPKTDALGLINVAIERKEEFDELWVVFDKDGYTKHKEAFEVAEKNGINIAFSSISFETWVLLHFERNKTPFAKSANIINEKFQTNESYLTNYAKSGDYNLFPYIENKTNIAFKNASWLRNEVKIMNPHANLYELNPYTDIDILVKKLILDNYTYESKVLNQNFDIQGVTIYSYKIDNDIFVRISNSKNRSLVLNEFEFYDLNSKRIELENIIIEIGSYVDIDLKQLNDNSRIFIKFEELRLEINFNI